MVAKVKRRSYIWNTVSGLINAGQSALIMIFISYNYSIEEVGVFSIGYAISTLGMTISKYGQRNYQVTDVDEDYSFFEYRNSRILMIVFTFFLLLGYLIIQFIIGNYSFTKSFEILFLCVWKQIDVIEDVYYGMYQQRGRLDIGAKRYSERLLFSTAAFCGLTLLKIPFLILLMVVVVLSFGMGFFLISLDASYFIRECEKKDTKNRIGMLLRECLSLCVSSTLAVFVGNLPKYFIDIYLNDSMQAQFGYLMMPAFVIMVVSMILLQPVIKEMGIAAREGEAKKIIVYIKKQLLYITIITGFVIITGGFFAIPVLSILYQVDLSSFWTELMVLFVGAGFYALSQFMIVPIVSMRKQNDIAIIYVLTTGISVILGIFLVSKYEIRGASVLYLVISIILSVLLLVDCAVRISGMLRVENKFQAL